MRFDLISTFSIEPFSPYDLYMYRLSFLHLYEYYFFISIVLQAAYEIARILNKFLFN